ncbi:hypothetical protein PspLS_10427 [Pyricularia sp. CBS 133598]|nr:hypothetical protein PspLS_10427 [Pyricularia sp. CBS 133598]
MPALVGSSLTSFELEGNRIIIASVLLASLALFSFIFNGRKQSNCESFPFINETVADYLRLGRKLLIKANKEIPDKPFRVLTGGGAPLVVLPPRYANEISKDARMSPREMLLGFWQAHLPGFEPFRVAASEFMHEVVKSKLTQRDLNTRLLSPLAEEAKAAVHDMVPVDEHEWRDMLLNPSLSKCVARVTTLAFLGPELCRNEEWNKIVTEYPLKGLAAGRELRQWHELLRPIVHWFLPCCKELRRMVSTARAAVEAIRQARSENELGSTSTVNQNNALSWMEQLGKTIVERRARGLPNKIDNIDGKGMENTKAADQQLGLAVLANASSTDVLAQTLLNICQNPELIGPLREEMKRETRDGWQSTTLSNLRLLDSVIKETLRLKPIGSVLKEGFVLSNGTSIPRNTHIAVSCEAMRDPQTYSDPDTFNGFRFYEKRDNQQDGFNSTTQMVATSDSFLSFGLGIYACPGRFMAATALKLLITHILLEYDIKLGPDAKPSEISIMEFGFTTMANPMAKVMIKRRQR